MATVIDALVVTLGLDKSKFNAGSREAKSDLHDLKKGAAEARENFRTLARAVVELFALFTAGRAVKEFIADLTNANAEMERLSRNTNTSTRDLAAWQGVAARSGGSAGAFQGTLMGLSRQMTEIAVTGQSSVLPYFRALGVHLGDAHGRARPLLDVMLDVADRLHALPDRQLANNLGLMMGFDQGTLNAMLEGRRALEDMLRQQRDLNPVTREQTAASLRLAQAWFDVRQASEGVGRSLLALVTPALTRFLEIITRGLVYLREHKALLAGIAAAIGVVLAPALYAAASAAWAFLAPLLLISAPILAAVAAIALLADDWNAWMNGGKSALGDFWQWWADLWKRIAESGPMVEDALKRAFGVVGRFAGALLRGGASVVENIGEAVNFLRQGPGGPTLDAREKVMGELQSEGYSWEQAAGITAALSAESGLNPAATNPTSGAYGIGQWLGARKAGLFAFARERGMDPGDLMTQLLYRRHEETSGSDAGAAAASRAIGASSDARTVATTYLEMNERPGAGLAGDMDRARATLWLLRMANRPDAATASRGDVDNSRSSEVHVGEVNIHTQATDARGIAHTIRGPLRDALADQADAGLW